MTADTTPSVRIQPRISEAASDALRWLAEREGMEQQRIISTAIIREAIRRGYKPKGF